LRANTHAYCNGNAYSDSDSDSDAYCYRGAEVYADAQAASHTGASSVRPAFNGRFYGDSRAIASPRNAYFS
jgi:hypothetical protein